MLTLRRKSINYGEDQAIIDIEWNGLVATLTLDETVGDIQIWLIESDDWDNGERYKPDYVSLMSNQSYKINDWLSIYGAGVIDGEAKIHISCDKDVTVNRRDRKR